MRGASKKSKNCCNKKNGIYLFDMTKSKASNVNKSLKSFFYCHSIVHLLLYHSQYGDWTVPLLSYPKLERMGEWFTILSSASLLSKAKSNEATRLTGTLLYQSLSPYKETLTGTLYFYMRDGTVDHTQIRLPYSCMDFPGCVEHVLYSRYTTGHVQIRRYTCL